MAKIVFDSEKELENLIMQRIDMHGHCPITGDPVDRSYQQLALGSYGITDIVTMMFEPVPGYPPKIHYRIIEIKKELIKNDSIAQISRYIKGLNHIISESGLQHEWDVSGILVAPGIDKSGDTCFLLDLVDDVDYYEARCDLDSGLSFKNLSGWTNNDSSIQENTSDILILADKEIRAEWQSNTLEMEAANG